LLKDILERKWTSIARLKKQVMDLERQCKQLKEASVDYEGYLEASSTPSSLLKDILERKWTSIARLKKQVMDLERQCKQLKETNE